jgi:hypothetical protein
MKILKRELEAHQLQNYLLTTERQNWRPYFIQFTNIADKYKWTSQERLDRLLQCLRDKALKFSVIKINQAKETMSRCGIRCERKIWKKGLATYHQEATTRFKARTG